jgi:hypothetical protein
MIDVNNVFQRNLICYIICIFSYEKLFLMNANENSIIGPPLAISVATLLKTFVTPVLHWLPTRLS